MCEPPDAYLGTVVLQGTRPWLVLLCASAMFYCNVLIDRAARAPHGTHPTGEV